VLKKPEFKSIYKGNDKRPLGLHSRRKTGSTQAKRRGAGRDQVDHRGRWVTKKGSRIVNQVYIDPEDVYADAFCASILAIGGPIKYKLKVGVMDVCNARWIADNVVPNISKRFPEDTRLINNLGLALLWLAFDEQAVDDLDMPEAMKTRIVEAYNDHPSQNKPSQPVDRVPLHVYLHGEETIIEEVGEEVTQKHNNKIH
jgi:hypothetical protein